jgi:hypothetical protein
MGAEVMPRKQRGRPKQAVCLTPTEASALIRARERGYLRVTSKISEYCIQSYVKWCKVNGRHPRLIKATYFEEEMMIPARLLTEPTASNRGTDGNS